MIQTTTLNHYLKIAESLGIIPNFYLSIPYLQLSQVRVLTDGKFIWIVDKEWCLFPPLSLKPGGEYPVKRSWSDFEGITTQASSMEILDWEYIFNPLHFKDLSGGKWQVYRKNIRKWPRANENWLY